MNRSPRSTLLQLLALGALRGFCCESTRDDARDVTYGDLRSLQLAAGRDVSPGEMLTVNDCAVLCRGSGVEVVYGCTWATPSAVAPVVRCNVRYNPCRPMEGPPRPSDGG